MDSLVGPPHDSAGSLTGPHGQPVNIQLMGRAWDDARLVGFAYAFERLANASGRGHIPATTVPALKKAHDDDNDHGPRWDDEDDDWDRWRRKVRRQGGAQGAPEALRALAAGRS